MNWKRMTLTALLTAGLMTVPALAQDASTSSTTSTQATTDHNDTNSKTKKAMKKAGQKTEDTASAAKDKMTGESKTKVDINSAFKEELAELPGMNADSAQKVIDGRPYKMKSQLVSKNIVSKDEYAKVKGDIVAKKSASSEGATATTKKKTKKTTTTTTTGPSMR